MEMVGDIAQRHGDQRGGTVLVVELTGSKIQGIAEAVDVPPRNPEEDQNERQQDAEGAPGAGAASGGRLPPLPDDQARHCPHRWQIVRPASESQSGASGRAGRSPPARGRTFRTKKNSDQAKQA